MTSLQLTSILLLSFILLSACGSEQTQNMEESAGSSEAVTHTVMIENMTFTPDTLKVSPGDTVEWINRDMFTHDVTSRSDSGVASDMMETDERFQLIIDEEFAYYCSFHQSMTGIILVN